MHKQRKRERDHTQSIKLLHYEGFDLNTSENEIKSVRDTHKHSIKVKFFIFFILN
jgi:hypothetical protein